jgi:hypothetical protein
VRRGDIQLPGAPSHAAPLRSALALAEGPGRRGWRLIALAAALITVGAVMAARARRT